MKCCWWSSIASRLASAPSSCRPGWPATAQNIRRNRFWTRPGANLRKKPAGAPGGWSSSWRAQARRGSATKPSPLLPHMIWSEPARAAAMPARIFACMRLPRRTLMTGWPAGRGLEEETGWRAGRLEFVMACPSSAGLSDETISFVAAHDLVRTGPGGGDASEDIRVHAVAQADIDDWLAGRHEAGLGIDSKIYTALYLRSRWR